MESDFLRVAVMSDLHCTHGGEVAVSYLLSDLPKKPTNRHPIESLKKVIQSDKINADILLCPGDITDKINKQGLVSGWQFLKEIKSSLNATSLMATLGNHDVDSRNQHKVGAFQFIKDQIDFEPTEDDEDANDSFWRNNYCIIVKDKFILLLLNSSFNHTNDELAKTSQIPPGTLERIDDDLKKIESNDLIRIAMCHHHPIHHSNSNLNYNDSDFIDKSDKLLEILERHQFNLVIHGHKHDPRIINFNSLTVFASGSFSSMANLMDIGAQNTFHLISIHRSTKKGTINTWIYQPLQGWVQKHDCYFPCFTGFGFKSDIKQLAKDCNSWFLTKNKESIKFSAVVEQFPDIIHLIPTEQIHFGEIMNKAYGLSFSPNLPNKPERLYNLNS